MFLDLEETVIRSWHDPVLMNVGKLRKFFKSRTITEIVIFSFAISDEKDKEHFERMIQRDIENAVGVKIVKVFTVEEIARLIRKSHGISFETFEIPLVWGKFRSFVDVCNLVAPKGSTNVW